MQSWSQGWSQQRDSWVSLTARQRQEMFVYGKVLDDRSPQVESVEGGNDPQHTAGDTTSSLQTKPPVSPQLTVPSSKQSEMPATPEQVGFGATAQSPQVMQTPSGDFDHPGASPPHTHQPSSSRSQPEPAPQPSQVVSQPPLPPSPLARTPAQLPSEQVGNTVVRSRVQQLVPSTQPMINRSGGPSGKEAGAGARSDHDSIANHGMRSRLGDLFDHKGNRLKTRTRVPSSQRLPPLRVPSRPAPAITDGAGNGLIKLSRRAEPRDHLTLNGLFVASHSGGMPATLDLPVQSQVKDRGPAPATAAPEASTDYTPVAPVDNVRHADPAPQPIPHQHPHGDVNSRTLPHPAAPAAAAVSNTSAVMNAADFVPPRQVVDAAVRAAAGQAVVESNSPFAPNNHIDYLNLMVGLSPRSPLGSAQGGASPPHMPKLPGTGTGDGVSDSGGSGDSGDSGGGGGDSGGGGGPGVSRVLAASRDHPASYDSLPSPSSSWSTDRLRQTSTTQLHSTARMASLRPTTTSERREQAEHRTHACLPETRADAIAFPASSGRTGPPGGAPGAITDGSGRLEGLHFGMSVCEFGGPTANSGLAARQERHQGYISADRWTQRVEDSPRLVEDRQNVLSAHTTTMDTHTDGTPRTPLSQQPATATSASSLSRQQHIQLLIAQQRAVRAQLLRQLALIEGPTPRPPANVLAGQQDGPTSDMERDVDGRGGRDRRVGAGTPPYGAVDIPSTISTRTQPMYHSDDTRLQRAPDASSANPGSQMSNAASVPGGAPGHSIENLEQAGTHQSSASHPNMPQHTLPQALVHPNRTSHAMGSFPHSTSLGGSHTHQDIVLHDSSAMLGDSVRSRQTPYRDIPDPNNVSHNSHSVSGVAESGAAPAGPTDTSELGVAVRSNTVAQSIHPNSTPSRVLSHSARTSGGRPAEPQRAPLSVDVGVNPNPDMRAVTGNKSVGSRQYNPLSPGGLPEFSLTESALVFPKRGFTFDSHPPAPAQGVRMGDVRGHVTEQLDGNLSVQSTAHMHTSLPQNAHTPIIHESVARPHTPPPPRDMPVHNLLAGDALLIYPDAVCPVPVAEAPLSPRGPGARRAGERKVGSSRGQSARTEPTTDTDVGTTGGVNGRPGTMGRNNDVGVDAGAGGGALRERVAGIESSETDHDGRVNTTPSDPSPAPLSPDRPHTQTQHTSLPGPQTTAPPASSFPQLECLEPREVKAVSLVEQFMLARGAARHPHGHRTSAGPDSAANDGEIRPDEGEIRPDEGETHPDEVAGGDRVTDASESAGSGGGSAHSPEGTAGDGSHSTPHRVSVPDDPSDEPSPRSPAATDTPSRPSGAVNVAVSAPTPPADSSDSMRLDDFDMDSWEASTGEWPMLSSGDAALAVLGEGASSGIASVTGSHAVTDRTVEAGRYAERLRGGSPAGESTPRDDSVDSTDQDSHTHSRLDSRLSHRQTHTPVPVSTGHTTPSMAETPVHAGYPATPGLIGYGVGVSHQPFAAVGPFTSVGGMSLGLGAPSPACMRPATADLSSTPSRDTPNSASQQDVTARLTSQDMVTESPPRRHVRVVRQAPVALRGTAAPDAPVAAAVRVQRIRSRSPTPEGPADAGAFGCGNPVDGDRLGQSEAHSDAPSPSPTPTESSQSANARAPLSTFFSGALPESYDGMVRPQPLPRRYAGSANLHDGAGAGASGADGAVADTDGYVFMGSSGGGDEGYTPVRGQDEVNAEAATTMHDDVWMTPSVYLPIGRTSVREQLSVLHTSTDTLPTLPSGLSEVGHGGDAGANRRDGHSENAVGGGGGDGGSGGEFQLQQEHDSHPRVLCDNTQSSNDAHPNDAHPSLRDVMLEDGSANVDHKARHKETSRPGESREGESVVPTMAPREDRVVAREGPVMGREAEEPAVGRRRANVYHTSTGSMPSP